MVTSWIGFFVDIHAQKLIEETLKDNKELKETQIELENYQRLLEKKIYELNISNNDLEQFAYIASHDLQEPLRKIRTFASLLETGLSLNSEQKMYFDKITSSTDRMSTLIRDVLNYSRLSKAAEEFTAVDLTQIIDNVKNDLEVLINEKDAVFYITALPVIQGNPSQLSQLFFNLISNSLKFSVSQPIIHISAKKLTADEIRTNAMLDPAVGYYQIIVADNGIGFEQQYAEQIFTIFQRLHDRQSYAGTGIGLALCKKILSNHRGVIRAESELEKGTSFYLYFPSNTLLLP
jgi:light-regulated signal transduction histidine kinase (bacteriophytochrome)